MCILSRGAYYPCNLIYTKSVAYCSSHCHLRIGLYLWWSVGVVTIIATDYAVSWRSDCCDRVFSTKASLSTFMWYLTAILRKNNHTRELMLRLQKVKFGTNVNVNYTIFSLFANIAPGYSSDPTQRLHLMIYSSFIRSLVRNIVARLCPPLFRYFNRTKSQSSSLRLGPSGAFAVLQSSPFGEERDSYWWERLRNASSIVFRPIFKTREEKQTSNWNKNKC